MGKLYRSCHTKESANYYRYKLVMSFARRGWHVLDIGCGDGTFAKGFADRKCFVDAVDKKIRINEICLHKNINYIEEDIFSFMSDRNYDLIYAGEICEHLDKPEDLINRCSYYFVDHNVKLIVTVPNFMIKSGGHKRTYSEKSLRYLLRRLRILQVKEIPSDDVKFYCAICIKKDG